jgi:hypothetical protein
LARHVGAFACHDDFFRSRTANLDDDGRGTNSRSDTNDDHDSAGNGGGRGAHGYNDADDNYDSTIHDDSDGHGADNHNDADGTCDSPLTMMAPAARRRRPRRYMEAKSYSNDYNSSSATQLAA